MTEYYVRAISKMQTVIIFFDFVLINLSSGFYFVKLNLKVIFFSKVNLEVCYRTFQIDCNLANLLIDLFIYTS